MKTCKICHKQVKDDAIFCTNCGNKLIDLPKEENEKKVKPLPKPKKRKIAFILAIFLGMFGAHDLYLGKKNSFIIKIAIGVVSLGILALLVYVYSIIEGLYIYFNKNYKDGYGRELI